MRLRLFLLIVFAVGLHPAAYPQLKGFGLGPYVERAFPAGTSDYQLRNGLGAGVSADIKLPGKLGLTGSAGFIHFRGRTDHSESADTRYPSVNAFPLRAGIKFRPLPLFYFKMEVGAAKYTNHSASAFLISPGIGIRVLGIDLQGKYERWYDATDTRFWGIRAGLNL